MSLTEIMFSSKGRIGRLSYFLYALLNMAILAIGAAIAIAIGQNSDAVPLAVFFGVALFGTVVYSCFALAVKRLHDMGFSGIHMIWIYLLGIAGSLVTPASPALGMILSLASFGVSLWVMLAPSVADNQYGPNPNATTAV